MKKSFAILAVVLAVFSMLYFSSTALAGKAAVGSVDLVSESGTLKSSMTFNYQNFVNFSSSIHRIQISNSLDFSSPVTVTAASSSQTSGVNCGALNSGTAYWRVVELSEEGAPVEISTPDYRQFTLPSN
jgi:hypothetical protein